MEHGRFAYSACIDRSPLRWPNDARVALWVIPNVEHFRFDELFPGGRAAAPPDVMAYAMRDYGNRVGVWRIMDVLDRYGIRATGALNAEICQYEPRIIEEGQRRGWEWMGHGLTNSITLSGMPEAEERKTIAEALRIIQETTGSRPRGWLGAGLQETVRTLDILRELGVDYVADWVNDDQPYAMKTSHGDLYSIPYSAEINDKRFYEPVSLPPEQFARRIKEQFDTLYEEGGKSGRVMAIAMHPYLSGVPHRISYLDEALRYIDGHSHIWWATGSDIIDAFKGQLAAAQAATK